MAVINLGGLSLKSELHRCDETIEIDCEDGDEECNSSSSTSRIRIEDFKGVTVKELNINSVEFRFLGEASNPCFKGAPDIDWDIVVSVIFNSPSDEIEVLVKGAIDPFPAFEMYAQLNKGLVKALFKVGPGPGKSPEDLFGGPRRAVDEKVTLRP